MGKIYEAIDDKLRSWISEREMFFVATAPSGDEGLLNCSPKGLDSFRVLGERSVAYLDLTGSGIETVAHLRQNGRIVIMFCAFGGPPKILRLYGKGIVHEPGSARFIELHSEFAATEGTRSIIEIDVTRIADSCGYGVPLMEFRGERGTLVDAAVKRGPEKMAEYRRKKNSLSLDGLAGWNEPY